MARINIWIMPVQNLPLLSVFGTSKVKISVPKLWHLRQKFQFGFYPSKYGSKFLEKNKKVSAAVFQDLTAEDFSFLRFTDLNHAIVSKKSLLRQNGLHLNRKGLEFIIRYSPGPFLSTFYYLGIFFVKLPWHKLAENYQKLGLIFLLIYCQFCTTK